MKISFKLKHISTFYSSILDIGNSISVLIQMIFYLYTIVLIIMFKMIQKSVLCCIIFLFIFNLKTKTNQYISV